MIVPSMVATVSVNGSALVHPEAWLGTEIGLTTTRARRPVGVTVTMSKPTLTIPGLGDLVRATHGRVEAREALSDLVVLAVKGVTKGSRPSPERLPQPEVILCPGEVAGILAIPEKTVIALCADGRLDGAFKAGRRWRIPGAAVRKMAGAP